MSPFPRWRWTFPAVGLSFQAVTGPSPSYFRLPSYTMCRTGAEAQPSSAAYKRLLWFRRVGGIHVCPRSSCAMLPGCAWTEGPFSDRTSRTLQRIRRKRAPTGGTTRAAVFSSGGPGWVQTPKLPAKPEENPTEEQTGTDLHLLLLNTILRCMTANGWS